MSSDNNPDKKSPRTVGANSNDQMPGHVEDQYHSHQLQPQATFTIATPAVTTILPMTENINDTSFMLPATSYQKESIAEVSQFCLDNKQEPPKPGDLENRNSGQIEVEKHNMTSSTNGQKDTESSSSQPISSNNSTATQDESSKLCKKRNKVAKKNTKLDAKSKLEKSRQSARECRARKKLRYQYLEDLVCNREKAVIKLREELSMFCELSKQIDVGTISDKERRLLTDQTKENA